MSLREQLLKSGLASQQQVKRAERESKKRQHEELGQKKQGTKPPAAAAGPADINAQAILEEQRRADRERSRVQEEERRLQELRSRAIDIMVHNDLSDPRATIPYYFVYDRQKISSFRVNEVQQLQLAQGQLAIASFDEFERFYLISRDNALKIALCGQTYLACFHDKSEGASGSASREIEAESRV